MKRQGFTLLELAVVVAILAVVFTLFAVGIRKFREAEARTKTTNDLRQIALSAHSFNDLYRKLPSAFGNFPPWNFRVRPVNRVDGRGSPERRALSVRRS